MGNYPYLIASLPDFFPDCEPRPFDCGQMMEFVRDHLDGDAAKSLDWLEAGLSQEILGPHFYRGIERQGSRFLRRFFAFDREVRRAKVEFVGKKGIDEDSFEEAPRLKAIFGEPNLIEREKRLDRLYWEKAEEFASGEILNLDRLLSLLVMARIAERWNRLDEAAGKKLFRELVQQVRGTFNGVEFDADKK